MGSPAAEEGRHPDEGPQQWITVTHGYWLADTPCTQALWVAVMGRNPSCFKGSLRLPVENVSWADAQSFLAKLNAQVPGLNAGLPTAAQWEYACRATSTEPRYGDLDEIAWYEGNSEGRTHEVGQKLANGWGLHDMLGNVWEWCADRSGLSGQDRAIRGGSWFSIARLVRAASRLADEPGSRNGDQGFRLAGGH